MLLVRGNKGFVKRSLSIPFRDSGIQPAIKGDVPKTVSRMYVAAGSQLEPSVSVEVGGIFVGPRYQP